MNFRLLLRCPIVIKYKFFLFKIGYPILLKLEFVIIMFQYTINNLLTPNFFIIVFLKGFHFQQSKVKVFLLAIQNFCEFLFYQVQFIVLVGRWLFLDFYIVASMYRYFIKFRPTIIIIFQYINLFRLFLIKLKHKSRQLLDYFIPITL